MMSVIAAYISSLLQPRNDQNTTASYMQRMTETHIKIREIVSKNLMTRLHTIYADSFYYFYDANKKYIWQVCYDRIGDPIFFKPKLDLYYELLNVNKLPYIQYSNQPDFLT